VYLTGDFHDKQSIILVIRDLKANGFGSEDLDIFSDEPVELPRGVLDRPSHMSLAVVTGAITLCLLVILFVYFTQYNYPLITGGMPLFSFWATGVVFYELTMFGAIVTTFFWFLSESKIMRRARRPVAPEVEPDVISLRVRCSLDQAETARRRLESAGADNVRTTGDI